MRLLMLCAMLALVVPTALAQQIYRWVDKDGRVHYTPTKPPAGEAKSVQRKSISAGGSESGGAMRYETQVAMKAHPVTLYVTPDCGKPCSEGRKYLDERGIPYKVVDINGEGGGAEAQRIAKTRAVPVLAVGRETVNGFEQGAWKDALDAAGYPGWAPKPAATTASGAKPAAGAQKQLPVVLYTAPNCAAPCERARALLAARKVPYEEINVDTDERAEELEKLSGGNTVPTMVVGKTVRKGFEPKQYNDTLDSGGYARP